MTPGIYQGRVLSHRLVQAQTGTWSVSINFAVRNSLTAEEETITADVYLSQKAMGIARKSLKAIGFDPDIQTVGELDQNKMLLAGNVAELDIDEEVYKGKSRMRVKWINPAKSGNVSGELDAITAALRAAKKKDEAEAPAETKQEDIPF